MLVKLHLTRRLHVLTLLDKQIKCYITMLERVARPLVITSPSRRYLAQVHLSNFNLQRNVSSLPFIFFRRQI